MLGALNLLAILCVVQIFCLFDCRFLSNRRAYKRHHSSAVRKNNTLCAFVYSGGPLTTSVYTQRKDRPTYFYYYCLQGDRAGGTSARQAMAERRQLSDRKSVRGDKESMLRPGHSSTNEYIDTIYC